MPRILVPRLEDGRTFFKSSGGFGSGISALGGRPPFTNPGIPNGRRDFVAGKINAATNPSNKGTTERRKLGENMNKSTLNRLNVPNRSVALGAIKRITAAVRGWHLALAAIVALFPTGAVATPGSGIVSATVFARASFADPTDIKFRIGREVIQVHTAQETVVQQIIIAPGGHTGWHSHPGPVVVLIKSGQMSFYDGDDPHCRVRTYSAGQSFVDSGQGNVHIARNEGSMDLELWATYFDVPPGGAFRIDAASPGNCSF